MMEASPVGSVSEFVGEENPSRKMSKSVKPRWAFIFLECRERERELRFLEGGRGSYVLFGRLKRTAQWISTGLPESRNGGKGREQKSIIQHMR